MSAMLEKPPTVEMSFREWMGRALFDPERGYYTTGIRAVGRGGDFATSASVGNLLGGGIAAWLKEVSRRHAGVRAVIEVGGGDGALSATVRGSLGWWGRRRYHWHMVEVSPVLQAKQMARLGKDAVTWHESMSHALAACDGRAFIFHNELVDAFPVTLMAWDGEASRWKEVWLRKEEGKWIEELRETTLTLNQLQDHGAMLPEGWSGTPGLKHGQRVELHDSYRDWMRNWGPEWKHGAMLTLDYGDVFPKVYHRQPRGTLRSYFMQQRGVGLEIYERMGRQDITADVNFSDLQSWAGDLGWRNVSFESQRDFLQRLVKGVASRVERDAAASFVMSEEGAGGAFKALVQEIG